MQDNETLFWSIGQNTEASEELETLESSHFSPVLQFMEIPYEEYKAEYFGILDDHIGEMWKGSKKFMEWLCTNLALGRFVLKECVGIKGILPLDIVSGEDFPVSHKIRARPINLRLFDHAEKKFF